MKKVYKLVVISISMVIVMAVMVVGIWAAALQVGGVTLSVNYDVPNVEVDYRLSVFNDQTYSTGFTGTPAYNAASSIDADDEFSEDVLAPQQTFKKYNPMYMVFLVKNLSDEPAYFNFVDENSFPTVSNVSYSYVYGVSSAAVTTPFVLTNLKTVYGLSDTFSTFTKHDEQNKISENSIMLPADYAFCVIVRHEIVNWTVSLMDEDGISMYDISYTVQLAADQY